MSFSDDYVPNAEGNLSNMSDVMEKSSLGTEIDLDEINDVLLKNLESDVFTMQNEFKQKDIELQHLLDELQKKFYAEKDIEFAKISEEYEEKIHALEEKTDELENALHNEKEQNKNYFTVIEKLESENEKLRDENRKVLLENTNLNDKLQKINQNIQNRSTSNSSGLMNAPPSPIAIQPSKHKPLDRNKNAIVFDLEDDISTSEFEATGFLKSGENLVQMDETWMNKFEFLKEKLLNEQNRSRELEFMIVTQKNIIENNNENMSKLKQDNKDLSAKIDKLRSEIDILNHTRIIEKTKVDSVITFCELMENCVFPTSELVEKLSELPLMITSYLKGQSETITFNKNLNSQSKLVLAAKKVKTTLEQLEEEGEKGDKNYRVGLVANELDDIKHGLTNLTQFLSKALPNSTAHSPTNSAQKERVPSNFETFKFAKQNNELSLKDQMANLRTNHHLKSSFFLAKAVQNSNSLVWNFNQTKQPGFRGSSEGRY